MTKLKLTVITPVFNEEEVIEHFHKKTRRVLDSLENVTATVLFVVDQCTDNTLQKLRDIVKRDRHSKVLSLSSRFGHQMALLAGIDHATDADVMVMMDSDLQHPPELIPQMLAEYRNGAAIVYTVRQHTEKVNLVRKIVGNLFYRLLGMISRVQINPNAADFRLINRRVGELLRKDFKERNMFLRGVFSWIGFKQIKLEYTAEPRVAGKSKYSVTRLFQLAMAGILSFSTKPLHTGIFVGVGFASLAFVFICSAVVSYFVDRTIPSGWTTLVILLLLFSGVQLIVIGIMGLYIGGIYEEVKGRPRYIIDEEIISHE